MTVVKVQPLICAFQVAVETCNSTKLVLVPFFFKKKNEVFVIV